MASHLAHGLHIDASRFFSPPPLHSVTETIFKHTEKLEVLDATAFVQWCVCVPFKRISLSLCM